MGGASPRRLEAPLTAERLSEIRELYEQVYATGLEAFFESRWYTSPHGVNALISSPSVNEMMAGFLQSMSKTDANDIVGMQYSANLEFRVVWDLACLVRRAEGRVNAGDTLPAPDDGTEARNRLAVVEALLAGDHLDQNLLMAPPTQGEYQRLREYRFWYYLAEFLRIKDQPNFDVTPQRDHFLGIVREVLDGRENRDVLYSFAVIRSLAPRFPADFENNLPPHLDETDPKSKLAVARKFIQDEAQVTGGTTNVVRRFSELAVRAFIVPGGNIRR
jgi:white-opaque regulator 2